MTSDGDEPAPNFRFPPSWNFEPRDIVKLSSIPALSSSTIYTNPFSPTFTPKYPPNGILLEKISLYQGDITTLQVSAIVNSANNNLLGGGGVDGAIHHAAGRQLVEECFILNGAQTGEAKITGGYKLPSSHVIHAVGPIYRRRFKDKADQLKLCSDRLKSCYNASLDIALEHRLRTIAFPSISTGNNGYPIEDATRIALSTVREVLDKDGNQDKFDRIIFVVLSDADNEVYESLLPEYFPPVPSEIADIEGIQ